MSTGSYTTNKTDSYSGEVYANHKLHALGYMTV